MCFYIRFSLSTPIRYNYCSVVFDVKLVIFILKFNIKVIIKYTILCPDSFHSQILHVPGNENL